MAIGKVAQIIGPVVDVRFPTKDTPVIGEKVDIHTPAGTSVSAEVMQDRGEGLMRCVAFNPTEGLSRGLTVFSTGEAVTVPVGKAVLGRMFNLEGQPIDDGGPIEAEEHWSIHRRPPRLSELRAMPASWKRALKFDLLLP